MPVHPAERVLLATRRRGREAAVIVLSGLAIGLWALRGRWVSGGLARGGSGRRARGGLQPALRALRVGGLPHGDAGGPGDRPVPTAAAAAMTPTGCAARRSIAASSPARSAVRPTRIGTARSKTLNVDDTACTT